MKNSPYVFITGASRGIGHALALEMANRGWNVIPCVRNFASAPSHPQILPPLVFDVTSSAAIRTEIHRLAQKGIKLDLVIHNAGKGVRTDTALKENAEILRQTYETNVFGVIEVNSALLAEGVLSPKAIIAFTASIMAHPSRMDYLWCAYRLSKATLIRYAAMAALEERARGGERVFLSFHPGSVSTELNPGGKISPQESAQHVVELLGGEKDMLLHKKNGAFWSYDAEKGGWYCAAEPPFVGNPL